MSEISVEISQFRPMDKGVLKGFFALTIHPQGQKILDCTYFANEKGDWFNLPRKEIQKPDGTKDYIPIVSYTNKEYKEKLNEVVLAAIRKKRNEVPDQAPKLKQSNLW